MNYHKRSFLKLALIFLMLLFVSAGCLEEENNSNPTAPTPPADPGPGNLAGKIVGAINGLPIAGAIVTARGISTSTGTNGVFRLNGVGEGHFGVVVSGSGIYTRTAAINTAVQGRSVQIDAIEVNSNFHLGFYRELARGNHPNEGHLYQTHRWINTTPPTVYINTDASATLDGVIDQNQRNTARSVVTQIVPVFTGNFYTSVPFQTRMFATLEDFDDVPDNSIIIAFDDTLIQFEAYGITFTEPDFVSPTTSTINKAVLFLLDNSLFYNDITFEEIIAHEMGHGFGFRHTSLLPSVMVAVGTFGGLFSEFDRLHMAVMYSRPAGNTDIDNDPIPEAKMFGQPLGVQVFIDRRANFPKSVELMERLQRLRGHEMIRRYIPASK